MKIIYETETGIAVIHPTGELPIDVVMVKDVPQKYMSTAKIVEDDIIPSDRTYRNAWKHENGKIVEDLTKSKEIHKEKLRADRKPLLEAQDVIYLKALEDGIDTKDIVKEKQRLRDITKLVDVCKSTDELKQLEI